MDRAKISLIIASLAGYLRKKGENVSVIDAPIENLDFTKTAQKVINLGVKFVGVSCLTENRYSALKILEEIKKLNPKIITIIGGLHATFSDKLLLENYNFIDIVVKGEGEETLYEIIKNKSLDKILGISFRKNNEIISNLPRPFIQNIEKALRIKNKKETIEKCKQLAKENSWHSRVDVIENAIKEYSEKNNIEI